MPILSFPLTSHYGRMRLVSLTSPCSLPFPLPSNYYITYLFRSIFNVDIMMINCYKNTIYSCGIPWAPLGFPRVNTSFVFIFSVFFIDLIPTLWNCVSLFYLFHCLVFFWKFHNAPFWCFSCIVLGTLWLF